MTPLVVLAVVAAWLGAALLFSAVVAPAAFAVLPSRALAGALVGRVLPVIFWAGLLFGVIAALLELRGAGVPYRPWRLAGAAGMVVSCAVAQLVIGPRISRLRAAIGPSLEALAADDPRRVAFGRLHAFSVAWLGVAMLAAVALAVGTALAARART